MEHYKLKVVETSDFSADIDSIDEFVYGTIDQETWQSTPIELNGKQYIKWKPILEPMKLNVIDIEIPIDDEV